MNTTQQPNPSTPPQKPEYLTVEGPIHVCTEEGAKLAHQLIDDAIADPHYDDIFHAMRALEATLHKGCPALNKTNPALAAKHKQKIMEAQWRVLWRLLPEEVEVLFSESLEYLFEHDTEEDIMPSLRRILHALIEDYEQRDVQKKKWMDAMAQSQAHIGEKSITVNGGRLESTVQNWLKLWREFIGDRAPDSLQVVQFMNSTAPVNELTGEERKKLEQVLKLQIELSKSSLTPEGNEDKLSFVDPVTGTIKSYELGQITDTGVKASQEDIEDARALYNVDEHGRPRTMAQALKHSTLIRYAKPELFGEKELPPTPTDAVPIELPVSEATDELDAEMETPAPLVQPTVQPSIPVSQPSKQQLPISTTPPRASAGQKTTAVDHAVVAQRVLAAHKLLLPTLELEHRFLSIITSYLKDVRDAMEARQALTATPAEGGVSLTASQAEAVLSTADEELEQWKQHPEKQRAHATKTPPPTPTLEMIRKRLAEQKAEQKRSQSQQPITASMEEPVDIFGSSSAPVAAPSPVAPASQPPTTQRPSITQQPVAPRPTAMPARGKQPTVMGPIDELKQLTVNEFRTLGTEARTASRAIIEKIHLLEQESIEKKSEAINAWKSSPLHQLYLDIGNQSLESTLPVEAVIKQREKQKQPTLTIEEFDAVADINRQLRF